MKESYLYKKLTDDKTQCQTCNHFCVIPEGKRGICGVRENKNGKLYLLVFGKAIAAHIDPIEKKPLFRFMPGTLTFSVATVGCNFRCLWCQNFDISQGPKATGYNLPIKKIPYQDLPPEKVIHEALKNDCPSISYTYTEPTIFLEYALDTMKLAHQKSLKNIWVSNGYFSPKTLELIAPYLDAINIDLKGFNEKNYLKYSGAKLKPVLDNIKAIHQKKIHLEITTLIIPRVNDSEAEIKKIANFIAKIDKNIPWHISRFFPSYKMTDTPPTPPATLKKALQIGKNASLKHVYLGNIKVIS